VNFICPDLIQSVNNAQGIILGKIRIEVNYLGYVRPLTQKFEETVSLDDSNILGLLKQLFKEYGLKFRRAIFDEITNSVKSSILILVNGKLVTNLEEKLEEGDRVVISTVAAGG